MDKLIIRWRRMAKELDAEAIKYNRRGGTTVMGNKATAQANQIRECIKDLQKNRL